MAKTREHFKGNRVRVLLAVGAAVAMLMAPSMVGAEDPSEIQWEGYGPMPPYPWFEPDTVVRIGDQGLSPTVVKLRKGQRMGWASTAQGPSVIVFEREVARSMICSSIINFHLDGDELRSGDLQAGDFASFCELAPGRYRYEVTNGFVGARRFGRKRLEGQIIVSAQ